MAAFSAVNSGLPVSSDSQVASLATPSTSPCGSHEAEQAYSAANAEESCPNTPTRHSFGGILGQKPLPDSDLIAPETPQRTEDTSAVKRDASHLEDVEMGDAEPAENAEDDASDDESVDGDGQRSSKKKKGQRFFCTEFPPCQLSFTRSEHLARHIRKHTGERPFQCHCSRRFSRLDNLRQHAQTVHVNEEIPAESLAATSTRFQRQIRTDRARPPNSRSRASTLGSSAGGGHRGHGRNLSASSIGSTTSSLGGDDDMRRRPQPLAMAGTDGAARARLSLETYNTINGGSSQQQYLYCNQSPTGHSTPTSTPFSTGGQSPRFRSGMTSPGSALSRNSYYNGARHSSNRRLSVPSAANPYQTPTLSYQQAPYFSPLPSGTSANFSQNSSTFGSPTSSTFSHGRRESESEMEWRRRTWHPSSNSQYAQRPATSGLTYHQTPDEPRPAFTQHQAASQMTRLPGIESFDHAPPPGIRQQQPPPDAVMPDASPRPMSSGRDLQQGLTRLDITAANAAMDGHWQAHQAQPPPPPPPQAQAYYQQGPPHATQYIQPKHVSMPEPPITPRRNKRNAWYGGPITPGQPVPGQPYLVHRPSPEDSGSSDGVPTPSTLQVNEYHPVIFNPSGPADYPPPGTAITTDDQQKTYQSHDQQQPPQTYALQSGHHPRYPQQSYVAQHQNDMSKLDALVAVATSEGSRAAGNRA